jgi:hypothetical protein
MAAKAAATDGIKEVPMNLQQGITSFISASLPVAVFIGCGIFILALLSGLTKASGPPAPIAKPLMTQREEAMLGVLEDIFPMYRFHAQVAMGALLKVPPRIGHRSSPADRNAFSQKIVDFVVQDPATGSVVALIEIDDGSHSAARDRVRDAMTNGAGYRTFRIPASAKATTSAVLRIVGPLREDAVAPASKDRG